MQYTVIEKETLEGLIEEVNKKIVLGYKPIGGVAVKVVEETIPSEVSFGGTHTEIECSYLQAIMTQ